MHYTNWAAVAVVLSLTCLACRSEAPTASGLVAFSSFASSEWSAPVSLGPTINSAASDQNAFLTKDGLTLFFSSNRVQVGSQGGLDIWVSQRATTADGWSAPQNVTALNSSAGDLSPSISPDGHLVFFASNRAGSTPMGGPGSDPSLDIYMSTRTDVHDPLAWGTPVRLGPGVNTASADQAPMYLPAAEDGLTNLYFNRGVLADGQGDIYSAAVTRDGETLGDAEPVAALNSAFNDAAVAMRHDGREIYFWSVRPVSSGQDLWTSTRQSVHHEWTTPTNAGAPLNSAANDLTPSLSFDGRTLIFSSNRLPSTGGNDLYITERTPSGQ